jgi:endonuclease YncB( thermonuclease family)
MKVSFDQWRRAEQRRLNADLRALKRGAGRKALRWSWRRLWPRRRSTSVIVVLAALAVAMGLETLPLRMVQFSEASEPVMASGASPSSVTGRSGSAAATVIDGDTLRIGGERLRLHGIDAPESEQRCADGWPAGEAARRALASLVLAGAPRCERVTTDRYGRTVAVCRVNGQDVGAALL